MEWPDVERIAQKMRERDRREICGLQATDDPVEAVSPLRYAPHIGATVWRDEPIAAVGALFQWPGVVSAFMFATDRWPEVKIEATRFVKRAMIPALYEAGVHRMQCYSMEGHTEAHAWLSYFGATARLEPELGKNRENYLLFVLDREGMARITEGERNATVEHREVVSPLDAFARP